MPEKLGACALAHLETNLHQGDFLPEHCDLFGEPMQTLVCSFAKYVATPLLHASSYLSCLKGSTIGADRYCLLLYWLHVCNLQTAKCCLIGFGLLNMPKSFEVNLNCFSVSTLCRQQCSPLHATNCIPLNKQVMPQC